MANVLNSIIANQPINPAKQDAKPAFIVDTEGKVKPMVSKGHLLPSKIFGSPVEYIKDVKKDVVNIKRAAKGQANDHELGRINDLAMKMGSFALATYLFVKNPLKLSKVMEFAGFGTFFASMALWPKLAIQLPLKLRTGVDIHQKYIDSQGRKKMLFQDPQYDLTDLYSREDLDKMGEKLGVAKNLPDRDNFIKQRAKKTAVQGNTLWMMTAGVATPVMSALACNRLEKPLGNLIEKYEMLASSIKLNKGSSQGYFTKLKQHFSEKAIDNFVKKNADKVADEKLIFELSSKLGKGVNSAAVIDSIKEEIMQIRQSIKIDEKFVRDALSGKMLENSILKDRNFDAVISAIQGADRELLNNAMEQGSFQSIASVLIKKMDIKNKRQRNLVSNEIVNMLEKAKKSNELPKLSQLADKIKSINSAMTNFAAEKGVLDRYISARIGDKSGTYIANQWSRVGNKLIKTLKLSSKELKALAEGDTKILAEKLTNIASSDVDYDTAVNELMKLINNYETKTGSTFLAKVQQKAHDICVNASSQMQMNGLTKIADKVSSLAQKGTIENGININTAERVMGAQSSFYRLMQSLDLFKKIQDGQIEQQLAKFLKEEGQRVDRDELQKLIEVCKNIILNATTTDYIEKLKSAGYELSQSEYKTVMRVLFDNNSETLSTLSRSLEKSVGTERASEMLKGFKAYKDEFMQKIANWRNGITPDLSRCIVSEATDSANAIERNGLAGKPIKSLVQDAAKQAYNSQKWLKIFGTTMAVLTVVTLTAGLLIGRKSKIEKKVEAESKTNG